MWTVFGRGRLVLESEVEVAALVCWAVAVVKVEAVVMLLRVMSSPSGSTERQRVFGAAGERRRDSLRQAM